MIRTGTRSHIPPLPTPQPKDGVRATPARAVTSTALLLMSAEHSTRPGTMRRITLGSPNALFQCPSPELRYTPSSCSPTKSFGRPHSPTSHLSSMVRPLALSSCTNRIVPRIFCTMSPCSAIQACPIRSTNSRYTRVGRTTHFCSSTMSSTPPTRTTQQPRLLQLPLH